MVQAVGSTRSSFDIESQSAQNNNQTAANNTRFSWTKAALATGVGSLLVGGGIGIGYAIRKPDVAVQNSNCLSRCGFDSQCALSCESKTTWSETCSSLLNSAYDHSEFAVPRGLIDELESTICKDGSQPSKAALKDFVEGITLTRNSDGFSVEFTDEALTSNSVNELVSQFSELTGEDIIVQQKRTTNTYLLNVGDTKPKTMKSFQGIIESLNKSSLVRSSEAGFSLNLM